VLDALRLKTCERGHGALASRSPRP